MFIPVPIKKRKFCNNKKFPSNFFEFICFIAYRPAIVLPSPDQFTIAARCCPLLFELRDYDESIPPIIALPYRMVFAVATKSSVCLYDTQQKMPIGLISNIHYARLTDLAWSSDGRVLVVSSSDGFCTLITFSDDELGTVYTSEQEKTDQQPMDDAQKCRPTAANAEHLNGSSVSKKSTTQETKPTPIAFRHTPRILVNESKPTTPPKFHITPSKDKILEIPTNIIQIDDKFDDTEPKNKVATPISVRRQPRCVGNNDSPGNQDERKTPNNKKQPTPIAIRRQPRVILQSGPSTTDDALDAWPIDQPKPNSIKVCDQTEQRSELNATTSPKCSDILDLTEDIRLVYEDSSMDSSMEEEVKVTPNSKTTRRVELRTISTPKSNKKLF